MSPILATILIVLVIVVALYLLVFAISMLTEWDEPNYWRRVFNMANGLFVFVVGFLVMVGLLFLGAGYLVNLIAGAVH